MIVFVAADSAGTAQLWLRSLESLGARPIPGTDNPTKPFWSPDSRWIGFFAEGKLKKARPQGGVETVCDAINGRGGTWSSKGVIVFTPSGEGPVYAVSAAGGEPRQVTTLDSTLHQSAHRFPCFLPDARHFLYAVLPAGARGFQVMIGSIDGGKDRPILTADGAAVYAAPGYLVFQRDRNLVAQHFDARSMRLEGDAVTLPDTPAPTQSTGGYTATVSANGALAYVNGAVTNSRLVWYDRSGRTVGVVGIPAGQYQLPNLSPDGRSVIVDRSTSPNETDLLMVDLARGIGTRFTYGPRSNSWGQWSPDGSRIVFESNRNGPFDLYVKASNGALPETPLLEGRSQFKHPFSWSPDGRLVAFYELERETRFDIWLVPADGSGPPTPYLRTPFQEQFPVISPDGRWMLYISDESGRSEAYVQSFPTPGHKYQVTTGGCLYGLWRGDGKEIILVGTDTQSVLSADVLESSPEFRAGAPRLLFRLPPNVGGMTVTRDGQRFLMPIPEGKTVTQSITVALNWSSALAAHPAAP
jgi:Tol biopolymer transport system component